MNDLKPILAVNPSPQITIQHDTNFEQLINISEKVNWRLDDIIPKSAKFDFSKNLLPHAFFPLDEFSFLEQSQKLMYNHILSYSYLNVFELSEEFIIGMALELAQDQFHENRNAGRALSRFCDEELKHQEMFRRARNLLQANYQTKLQALENYHEISDFILGHSKPATLLLTIHLELITQAHYLDGVKDDQGIDPLFCYILKHHWIEECQHIKIDILEFNRLVADLNPIELESIFEEYSQMIIAFVHTLSAQATLNIDDFESETNQQLAADHRQKLLRFTHAAYCNGLLKYGFKHAHFIRILGDIYSDSEIKLNSLNREVDYQIDKLN